MVTPFDADGRLDEEAAVRLMRHLLDNGSDGLVLAGTTGEGSTMDDSEKLRLWQLAVDEFGGRTTLVAGTGSNDTAHTVHLTAQAGELGMDAMLVVTPYYNKPNPRGIKAHFEAAANATDKTIVVYNIPSRCVVDIPNDLLRELAQIDNVSAVKQARFDDVRPIDGMDLLAGNDDMLARIMDVGGTGGILVASHLFGREMQRIVEEPDARAEVDAQLRDAYAALGVTVNPIPIKTALALLDLIPGHFRLPMVPASPEEEAEVRSMLERHGLLQAV
jgi:4-hydroxy-tetrahydrodipicolinate synthase